MKYLSNIHHRAACACIAFTPQTLTCPPQASAAMTAAIEQHVGVLTKLATAASVASKRAFAGIDSSPASQFPLCVLGFLRCSAHHVVV